MAGEAKRREGAALLVGIGAYQHTDKVAKLRYAARDAEALAEVLTDPGLCGFPGDRVMLLTDDHARREDVVHQLSKWLPDKAKGASIAVVYFAGHGTVQRVGQRDEGFLMPFDADPDDLVTRGVAMTDVARWIEGIDAKAVVVCFDCCHAGKVVTRQGSERTSTHRDMRIRPALYPELAGRGRFLIASCDEGQTSVEAEPWGHGLFTYHLLRGLRGEGDRDGDGRVGVAELFEYVAEAVEHDARSYGTEQRPWYSAVGPGGVYISAPGARAETSTLSPYPTAEQLWREEGPAAAVSAIERDMPGAGDNSVLGMLDLLGRIGDPAGVPTIFSCLAAASETVRGRAKKVLQAYGWEKASAAVEELARKAGGEKVGAVLDGLAAFESHREVVALLDRLVSLLKGDPRTRAILLLERKRLGLEVEKTAALFRAIHSPFQIQKALGQGLITAALLARDEELDLNVVVRVLRPEFASQPHLRAKFLDISRKSVHFVHHNLVMTREVRAFPDHNLYYAVRDHVEGPTLQRRLESGESFTPARTFAIIRQILDALTPLHAAGVVHRGIKPTNVFLCGDDRVVLGDVSPDLQGVTVALDRLSYDYRYASPEGFRGDGKIGPEADLYALGCLAYELACGRPPFVSDHPFELVVKHCQEDVEPINRRGSRLGCAGDAFILRLLAKSPLDRLPGIAEALRALAAVVEEGEPESVSILPVLPPAEFEKALKKRLPPPALERPDDGQSLVLFSGVDSEGVESGLPKGHLRQLEDTDPGSGNAAAPALGVAGLGPLPRQFGRYVLQKELGRGGMGVVYKATDVNLGRDVAIKMVVRRWHDSDEALHRFRAEARAVARLQHPNIVQIFEMDEQDGVIFYALELVEGGSLADRRGESIPPADAARLVATLARAVHYAHSQGVIHRDLKPSNILLTADGTPKISDFGLAKRPDTDETATTSGVVMGTVAYMSPEQARGMNERIGPATDVFALGVILYELLTGRRPFRGASPVETQYALINQHPAPPTSLNAGLPIVLDRVCMLCLSKPPEKRYPSAAALAEDLKRFLAGAAVQAPPVSRWRRLMRRFPFGSN
jgi:serine/threonine protein kinase